MNMIKLFAIKYRKYLNRTINYHIFQGSRQLFMMSSKINFTRQKYSIRALYNMYSFGRNWNPIFANSVYGINVEHRGFKKIYNLDKEFRKLNELNKMIVLGNIRSAEEDKRLVELFIREEP